MQTANEAFEKTRRKWNDESLTDVSDFLIAADDKINEAIEKGQSSCVIGVIPATLSDKLSQEFEEAGYFVELRFVNTPGEPHVVLSINWRIKPIMNRGYLENIPNS